MRRRSVKRKSLYPQCVFMMMINTAAKCVQWIISPRRCPIGKKRKKNVWSESQNEIHLKCKSDDATPLSKPLKARVPPRGKLKLLTRVPRSDVVFHLGLDHVRPTVTSLLESSSHKILKSSWSHAQRH